MSRSGYSDDGDIDEWSLIRWRGAVASAKRGKRGQAFFREALAALDALPEPSLIPNDLAADGAFCTLGAVGRSRGTDMASVDVDDHEAVARLFGIPHALACEVMWENDEAGRRNETPRARWERMRRWIIANMNGDLPAAGVAPEARAAAQPNLSAEGAQQIDEVNRKPTEPNTSKYPPNQHHPSPSASAGGDGEEHQS